MTTFDATVGAGVIQTAVNFSASGDNTILTGQLGKSIKILQFFLVWAAGTTITYKSGSTTISGPMTYAANGGQAFDYFQLPLTCNPGDNFVINSANAVQVGGIVWWALI